MNKLTKCLINKDPCLPVWFMRQAGRHLPEFRKIRLNNPNFMKLCSTSNLCTEITLQPVIRYNLDAAIIFSDILMVPYALGQNVEFEKGKGPKLSKFNIENFLKITEEDFTRKLNPIYEAIKKTRSQLDKNINLIAFVGSPWTLIVYMLGFKLDKKNLDLDIVDAKKKDLDFLFKHLTKFICLHIKNQIDAGADVIQIFDSWAGLIPKKNLVSYCYAPNLKLVEFCKKENIPAICFPKGIKENYLDFLKIVKPEGLSIDYDLDPEWARKNLEGPCIQGGMDPKVLLEEDKKIFSAATKYLQIFKNYPYIFNLGHGLLPETNPEKVNKLVNFVRNY